MTGSDSSTLRSVLMPSIEVGMDVGRLVEFLVEVGAHVSLGQPLFTVEGEKATVEIEAPVAGRIAKLVADAGTDLPVGAPVLVLAVQTGGPT